MYRIEYMLDVIDAEADEVDEVDEAYEALAKERMSIFDTLLTVWVTV